VSVSNIFQQSTERLELLDPLLAPTEADRCEAIGKQFIVSRNCPETRPDSGRPRNPAVLDLLHSLKLSLIERGGTLAELPRDRAASQQLGLDFLTYQALRDQAGQTLPAPELLQLVLRRFQSRARYWSEVAHLLPRSEGREPDAS
jgi:hypothetical protein